jgi:hypothetical protein
MKKTILLLGILLLSLTAFSQLNNEAKYKCKSYAKEKWGTDYSMVEYEYNKQIEAGDEFFVYYGIYNCGQGGEEKDFSEECMILIQAFAKWSDEGTGFVQWDMVVYEVKKQLEAYNNLK